MNEKRATPHGDAERAATPTGGDAAPAAPEGDDADDGFFCDGCSAVIQEAAAWIGNSAYCKDCVGRLCESYFKDGTKPRRKRAQHAHPPSASPQSAPEGNDAMLNALYDVAASASSIERAWRLQYSTIADRFVLLRDRLDRLDAARAQAGTASPPSTAAAVSAPEGKDNANHRAQAIYDVLMARGLVSPLDGMRKLGVYHAILDGLLVKLDADGEPTQADADAIPLRASPCAPPEGKDYPALNQCDGCVHGDPVRDGMHQDAEGRSYMMCQADKYAPTAAIDAPPQADADAIPLRASPSAPPEGIVVTDAMIRAYWRGTSEWCAKEGWPIPEADEKALDDEWYCIAAGLRAALEAQAQQHAHPPSASPQSAPEGFGDRDALIGLIGDLSDDERCRLDHHGYCQTHSWMDESRCPHARARDVLRAASQAREASPPAPGLRPSAPPEGNDAPLSLDRVLAIARRVADEREALIAVIERTSEGSLVESRLVADAVLAAGFRRGAVVVTEAMVEAALDEWLRDGKGDRHRYPTADAIMRDGMRRALAAALEAAMKGKASDV